jgi:hypothetical protein
MALFGVPINSSSLINLYNYFILHNILSKLNIYYMIIKYGISHGLLLNARESSLTALDDIPKGLALELQGFAKKLSLKDHIY